MILLFHCRVTLVMILFPLWVKMGSVVRLAVCPALPPPVVPLAADHHQPLIPCSRKWGKQKNSEQQMKLTEKLCHRILTNVTVQQRNHPNSRKWGKVVLHQALSVVVQQKSRLSSTKGENFFLEVCPRPDCHQEAAQVPVKLETLGMMIMMRIFHQNMFLLVFLHWRLP